jgi:hypothetical protein
VLVLYLPCVYVVLLLAYLVILPWVGCLAHHVLVCPIWASSAYWCYLIWLFEIISASCWEEIVYHVMGE